MQGKAISKAAAAILAVLMLAACGSSSGSSGPGATTLLRQTFGAGHKITSGVISVALTVQPTGSSILQGPISLSLGGPFQSRGAGQVPESNLTIAFSGLGHHGQLGIVSTGTAGYVLLQGSAYQLPASDFQRLQSGFSGTTPGSGGLRSLGIDPLHWLSDPRIVGHDTVAGAPTTHLRARVNVPAMLADLNTFLRKRGAAATGGSSRIPTSIPPSVESKIAAAVKNPSVDVWTGSSDHALRRLAIGLDVPVTGRASTTLGGMTSAQIALTIQYAELNQPQTIAAPENVRPFAEFAARVRAIAQQVAGSFGLSGLGAGTGTSGGSSSGASNVGKYTQCIQKAAGNVTKMQKCAALINGG